MEGFEIIKHSENLDKLFTSLSKVQAELEHAPKSADNLFFKSKYADLPAVLDTGREVASKHGICVTQFPTGKSGLMTVLGHTSGQYMMALMQMTPENNKPQTIGSCITYARRYAYAAVLGIAQDDDDGNAASGKTNETKKEKVEVKRKEPKPDSIYSAEPDQKRELADCLKRANVTDPDVMKAINFFCLDTPTPMSQIPAKIREFLSAKPTTKGDQHHGSEATT